MTAPPPTTPTTGDVDGASDLVTSWLRTTVPTLWGASTAAALSALAPSLPTWSAAPLGAWLSDESTTLLVTVAVVAAWHAGWRRLEGRVPAWVARVALGSARRPTYRQDGAPGASQGRGPGTEGPTP